MSEWTTGNLLKCLVVMYTTHNLFAPSAISVQSNIGPALYVRIMSQMPTFHMIHFDYTVLTLLSFDNLIS